MADTKKAVKQVVKKEVKKVTKGKDKEAAKKSDSDEEAEPVKLIASKPSKMATKAAHKKKEEDEDDIGLPDSDEDEAEPAPKKEVKKAPAKKETAKKAPAKKEVAKAAKPVPKKEEAKKPKPVARKEVKKQVEEVEEEVESSIDLSDEEDEPAPKKQVQAKKQVPTKKEAKKEAKPIKKPAKPVQQEPEEEEDSEKLEEDNGNEQENEADDEEGNEAVKENNEEVGEEDQEEAEEKEEVQEEVKKPSKKEAKKEEGEREVFIGNLPFTATEAEVNEFFAYYGPVESVQLTKRNGRPSGNGFVKFEKAEAAAKAVAESGQYLQNRSIKVHYASDNPATKEPPQGSTTVFVGGLSYNSTQETVSQFFSECGNVIRVRIATDPSGTPKGFAHVEFDSEEAVQNAMGLSGQTLDGRRIRVDVAAARGERPQGGFPPRAGQRPGAPHGAPQRRFPMKPATGNEAAAKNKGLIQPFQGKKKKL